MDYCDVFINSNSDCKQHLFKNVRKKKQTHPYSTLDSLKVSTFWVNYSFKMKAL